MNGSEVFTVIGSMFLSFLLGFVGMMLIGGKMSLNYLLVKMSRGRKVLIFGKTNFGWKSFVAKKENNSVKWKYDGKKITTYISSVDVSRFLRIDMVFVDADKPAGAITLKENEMYPTDFDPAVFNNILIRAVTRPTADADDIIKKLMFGALILLVLIGLGVVLIYSKLGELTGSAGVI